MHYFPEKANLEIVFTVGGYCKVRKPNNLNFKRQYAGRHLAVIYREKTFHWSPLLMCHKVGPYLPVSIIGICLAIIIL